MDSNQLQPCKRKKKKQRRKGVAVDRISELPDDILFTILSFLSTREAAATSILSPRWSNLWKHTPNLDFFKTNYVWKTTNMEHNSWDVMTCRNVKMVNSALESHQALCLKQFRIHFYINKSAQSTVTKWLEFVWSRQVESLYLNFQCLRQKHAVVLEDMLGEMRPMKYLKKLSLRNVIMSGENISSFLRNCPLLRILNIRSSSLTSDVHVCGATLMLEYLQIHGCDINESVINISAPNLSEVKIDASSGQLWFKNVPRLVVATFMHHFAFEVSCITSQLQKLTLSLSYTESILANSFPQMPNLKKLIIIDNSLYKHGYLMVVTSVIKACPRLQKFKFKFLDKFEDETPEAERCPHQRLEMLEFQGSSASNIIQSMTYIADNCDEFQKLNTCAPLMSKAEVQAHKDHLKQLQVQLSHQFRLRFFKVT